MSERTRLDRDRAKLLGFGLGSVLGFGRELFNAGRKACNVLRMASNVADQETITIDGNVFEANVVNTDSTKNTANGDLNNTTNPAPVEIEAHGLEVNDLIRVENEYMRVVEVVDEDNVIVHRGYGGSTNAAHADGLDIFVAVQSVGAGRFPVPVAGTLTPAVFTDAFIATLNAVRAAGRFTPQVEAVDISANEVLIRALSVGVLTLACTETLGGANNAFAAAAMYGGADTGVRKLDMVSRVPNAVEVALGNLHFDFDFAPTVVAVLVAVTATPGVAKAWDGAATVTGNRVTLDNAGSTDWAATDTVTLIVTG